MSRIVITGANGFLGSHLADYFSRQGTSVLRLQRDRGTKFDLRDPAFLPDLEESDILIHAAYDFKARTWDEIRKSNIEGSLRLIDHARRARVRRIVFISTMSAYEGCPSDYGKAKRAVESVLHSPQDLIVRPGLIYAETLNDGMIGALSKIVFRLPLIPIPDRGQQRLHAVEVKDLCRSIDSALTSTTVPNHPLVIAHPERLTLAEILRRIARRSNSSRIYLPIPSFFILSLLKAVEAIGIRPRTRADSLIGLLHQDPAPDFAWAKTLNLKRFLPESASTKDVES